MVPIINKQILHYFQFCYRNSYQLWPDLAHGYCCGGREDDVVRVGDGIPADYVKDDIKDGFKVGVVTSFRHRPKSSMENV